MFQLDGKLRNYVFFITLIAVILLTGTCVWLGERQNQAVVGEHVSFNQAVSFIESGDYAKAEPILAELAPKFQDSWLVMYYYGLTLEKNQKHREARIYLEKARRIRPALLTSQGYLYLTGQNFLAVGERQRAQAYLKKAIVINSNETLTNAARQLLNQSQSEG